MEQKIPNHISISRSSERVGSSTENDMTDAEIFELNSLMAMQGKILTQNDIDYINTRRRVNARRGIECPFGNIYRKWTDGALMREGCNIPDRPNTP